MRPRRAVELVGQRFGVDVGGLVFGISNTAVTPPSAAARLPVSQIFLVLDARLAEMHLVSMTPGSTCRPVASMLLPAWLDAKLPMAAILPP